MSGETKTYVVFPEGDFDLSARMYEGFTIEEAVEQAFQDADMDDYSGDTLCAFECPDIRAFQMQTVIQETTDE